MATLQELKELALHAARGTAPANYTAETVDEAIKKADRAYEKLTVEVLPR